MKIHGRAETWKFSSSAQFNTELDTRRTIFYLRATIYYFVYSINILLTRRSRLNSRFKERTRCHLFTVLYRASDVSAADWLSHTLVKKYRFWNASNYVGRMLWFAMYVEGVVVGLEYGLNFFVFKNVKNYSLVSISLYLSYLSCLSYEKNS